MSARKGASVVKRGWIVAVALVLVAEIALGWLNPWESRDGRWLPPAVVVLFLILLAIGATKTRR